MCHKKLIEVLLFNIGSKAEEQSTITKQLKNIGRVADEEFSYTPELKSEYLLYYMAYQDLVDDRDYGINGALPIRWQTIENYAVSHGVTPRQKEWLHVLLKRMDRAYLGETSVTSGPS